MRRSLWLWVPLSLIAAAVLWSQLHEPARLESKAAVPAPAPAPGVQISPASPAAPAVSASTPTAAPTAPAQADAGKPLFIDGIEATLRADAEGSLIIDMEARSALEMLIGMSARER